MKIGRANYFSMHRAFPNRTLGCLWERISDITWGFCSWDCVVELVLQGSPELPGVWSVGGNICATCAKPVQTSALLVSPSHWLQMESRETSSNCPDHKLPCHPRCQGRFCLQCSDALQYFAWTFWLDSCCLELSFTALHSWPQIWTGWSHWFGSEQCRSVDTAEQWKIREMMTQEHIAMETARWSKP